MSKIGYIMSFIGGAFVGAVVAYKLAFDKAEEKADLEIEEMRQYFESKILKQHKAAVEVAAEKSKQSQNKPSIVELTNVKSDDVDAPAVDYTVYSESPQAPVDSEPVVLASGDEFGEITHYSRVNLTFYDDLVLADDSTMKTFSKKEAERAVGKALEKFRNSDVDEVYVRNDRTKTYYDIVRSEQEYAVAAGWEEDGTEY